MSLLKQLLIIISALFLMIFSVNFAISVNNIRSYLQGEAEIHAQDTATSLGLSLSPYMHNEADPVILTMMNAIFDMGYYKEIKLVNVTGKSLVTLSNAKIFTEVPAWFVEYLPMQTTTASSEISSGWSMAGAIYVTPNPGYAYLKLYAQAKRSFYYSLITFVFANVLLFLVLRFTLLPLKKIEKMALRISEGQFELIERLPWTTEVSNVTKSMNIMSGKIAASIKRLNAKLDIVGAKLKLDDLTGLHKKSGFNTEMKRLFVRHIEAYIFMIKVDGLTSLVKERGSDEIDLLLKDFAQLLTDTSDSDEVGIYRFYGAEFVVLLQGATVDHARELAQKLSAAFSVLGEKYSKPDIAHIGVTPFNPVVMTEDMLFAANEAYEKAQIIGANSYFIGAAEDKAKGIAEWKALVFSVVDNRQYTASFVNSMQSLQSNQIVMQDVFTLVSDDQGNAVAVGTFISIAEKFAKIVELDKGVIEQVLEHIKAGQIQYAIAISLSTRTIKNSDFRLWLAQLLTDNQDLASQLVFSFSAYAVEKQVDIFQEFIEFVHKLNAKSMIKRFEYHSLSIEIAKQLKPDYIRLARDVGQGITGNKSQQVFVATIQEIGELLDIDILAENVVAEQDFNTLKAMRLSGASR